MPKRSPTWSMTEYSCLSDDLSGPEAMLSRQSAQSELTSLRQRLVEKVALGPRGAALSQAIEERILSLVRANSDKEHRRQFLRSWALKFRERLQESIRHPVIGREAVTAAVHQIRDSYSSFNIDQFREDFAAAFAEEIGTADPVAKEIEEITTAAKSITKANPAWKVADVRKFFRDGVPHLWRDYRMDVLGEVPLAETILKLFVHDWRSRAPLFPEPVTACGIAIRCLPTSRRDHWRRVYDRMRLGEQRKVPMYDAVILNIPDDTAEVSSLPGKFGGSKG